MPQEGRLAPTEGLLITYTKVNQLHESDCFERNLLVDLNYECIDSTRVPWNEGGEINFGYILHFEEYDVGYFLPM